MDSDRNSQPIVSAERYSQDVHNGAVDDDDKDFDEKRPRKITIVATPPLVADRSSVSHLGNSSNYSDIIHDMRDVELNTEDGDDDTVQLFKTTTVPNDRFYFNYLVFYLFGMIIALPWNFFMTADDYWMYKFRNVTSNSTIITPMQATFTSDFNFASSFPSTIVLILNAMYGHKFRLHVRMIGSLILILIFFAANTVLIKVNTDAWQNEFFNITICSVVAMNIFAAILSGGLFGISGRFPSEYMTAVVSGLALGSVLTAIIEIITITFASDPIASALIFFSIGNIMLVVSIVAYILMIRTAFFQHYTADDSVPKACEMRLQRQSSVAEPNYKEVLNKMWLYGFTVWLVFTVTSSIYPAITVLINSEGRGNGHPWNDVYFIPVTNYLIYNLGDYLGRILAGSIEWPNDKYTVAVLSMLRIAFVPALLICNTNPRHYIPVFIHSDYIFILLMCFFAFSNGYLANIALIWAPKCVSNHEKEMASSIMAALLGISYTFGSSLSLILVQFI